MGIVGQNGAGKTTLLNSIAGEIIPDGGEIRVQKGIKVGYLDQHAKINGDVTVFEYLKTAFDDLYEINDKLNKIYENMCADNSEETMNKASDYQNILINRGFYEIESTVLKVADGLGIVALGMDSKLKNLSGGQRAKVILAKLLLETPDVLLLDEPTNFLDANHIKWLTEYLKYFKNAFIVISHDFKFLDEITTCICDIEFENIKKYTGNFTKFLNSKKLNQISYEREFKAQQTKINDLETYIAKNKARASTAKQAQSRQKQLDKMEKLAPPQKVAKPKFDFEFSACGAGRALTIQKLEVGYNGKGLLPKLNYEILTGDKVVIKGFNGIGKSTLLKTLVGQIPPVSGFYWFFENIKVAYFEQDLVWKYGEDTPLQIIMEEYPKLSVKDARTHLAQCGIKAKDISQPVNSLSGGEQAKVKLCLLTLTPCNFLILDEPTNHLDALAKEALKDALKKWEGNIILVSHDPDFYKGLGAKIIDIEKIKNEQGDT